VKKAIVDLFVVNKTTDEIIWEGRRVVTGEEGYGDFDADTLRAFALLSAGIKAEEVENYAVDWKNLISYRTKE